MKTKEFYLHYPADRDIVFVLGAGTSYPDGVPLQRDILPIILSGGIKEIEDSPIGKSVLEFICDNFYFDPVQKLYPQLEAIFGYIDHFLFEHESLSYKYSNSYIYNTKENLIKLIHYIVDLQTNKKSSYYQKFWEAVYNHNKNISVITLNYDTLLEQAFDFLFPDKGLLDYSFHMMNYNSDPTLKPFDFWINPREPVIIKSDKIPAPFKVLKLHGSLNWKYCNCCNQTLLTPWDRKIDLYRGKLLGYTYPDNIEYDYTCPIDGTDFQTLIIPPSFQKFMKNPVITQLMNESAREIRSAKKIVFIGYSLSITDVHIKALFKKNLKEKTPVLVISKNISEALKAKYKALSKNIEFIDCSFENLVTDEQRLAKIFD
jgi:NAD-dependent SIR2 family protein deacetylase